MNATEIINGSGQNYDVWMDHDGRVTALPAVKLHVDDRDAPYGYYRHEIRVTASSRKEALASYRTAFKAR